MLLQNLVCSSSYKITAEVGLLLPFLQSPPELGLPLFFQSPAEVDLPFFFQSPAEVG